MNSYSVCSQRSECGLLTVFSLWSWQSTHIHKCDNTTGEWGGKICAKKKRARMWQNEKKSGRKEEKEKKAHTHTHKKYLTYKFLRNLTKEKLIQSPVRCCSLFLTSIPLPYRLQMLSSVLLLCVDYWIEALK